MAANLHAKGLLGPPLRRSLPLVSALVWLCVSGCAGTLEPSADMARSDDEHAATADGKGDSFGVESPLVDGTPAAVGLLGLLNAPETTFEVLDVAAGIDRRAAEQLIAHRYGPDGTLGTPDDDDYDSVAEVEAVPYVGEATLRQLVAYAAEAGWIPTGSDPLGVWDDVAFTVDEAEAVLTVVNTASQAELDGEVGLDSRAAQGLVDGRPFASVPAVAEVPWVGPTALERLKAYANRADEPVEIGIISDLDKTIIPPHSDALPEAPYPGVAALLTELEYRSNGRAGDVYFVTARSPDRIEGIPAWLAEHGIPTGPIETGTSGLPWVAEPEKVADISSILLAHPDQRFILFGDTNHRDPEVFREILSTYPDRITAALVHRVSNIDPARVEGLVVYANYAEAAAHLYRMGELDELGARAVMLAARAEGLDLSDEAIEELLSR